MYITLEQKKKLELIASQTHYDNRIAYINDSKRRSGYKEEELEDPYVPTVEAVKAKEILKNAVIVLTKEQKEELEQIASQTHYDDMIASINKSKRKSGYREDELEDPYIPTAEAVKAKEILDRSITEEELHKQKAEILEASAKEITELDKKISEIDSNIILPDD